MQITLSRHYNKSRCSSHVHYKLTHLQTLGPVLHSGWLQDGHDRLSGLKTCNSPFIPPMYTLMKHCRITGIWHKVTLNRSLNEITVKTTSSKIPHQDVNWVWTHIREELQQAIWASVWSSYQFFIRGVIWQNFTYSMIMSFAQKRLNLVQSFSNGVHATSFNKYIMNTKSTFKLNFLLISCYVNTQMYSNILWNLWYFPLYVIFIYLYLSPTTATWSLQYNNCNRFLDHVKQFSRSSIWNQV